MVGKNRIFTAFKHFLPQAACDRIHLTSLIGNSYVESFWKRWRFYFCRRGECNERTDNWIPDQSADKFWIVIDFGMHDSEWIIQWLDISSFNVYRRVRWSTQIFSEQGGGGGGWRWILNLSTYMLTDIIIKTLLIIVYCSLYSVHCIPIASNQ